VALAAQVAECLAAWAKSKNLLFLHLFHVFRFLRFCYLSWLVVFFYSIFFRFVGATIVFLRWLAFAQNNVYPLAQITLLGQLSEGVDVAVSA
jgi:hypothetical protein